MSVKPALAPLLFDHSAKLPEIFLSLVAGALRIEAGSIAVRSCEVIDRERNLGAVRAHGLKRNGSRARMTVLRVPFDSLTRSRLQNLRRPFADPSIDGNPPDKHALSASPHLHDVFHELRKFLESAPSFIDGVDRCVDFQRNVNRGRDGRHVSGLSDGWNAPPKSSQPNTIPDVYPDRITPRLVHPTGSCYYSDS